jgi:hypothetical protein
MRRPKSSTFDWVYYLAVAIFAICAAALVYYGTRFYGAGVSTDSVKYISAARNFIAGKGLYIYDGSPLTSWPPLYPFELAVPGFLLKSDPELYAGRLNALVFGSTILAAGFYFRRKFPCQPLVALLGTTAFLFSIPLFTVSLWAWSEPLFNLFLVFTFTCIDWYLAKKDYPSLIGLSICAGLAAITRYVGVTVILLGGIVILLTGNPWKEKVKKLFLFGCVSCLPIVAWVVRNFLLAGLPFGNRWPSPQPLADKVLDTITVVTNWFLPVEQTWQGLLFSLSFGLAILLYFVNQNSVNNFFKDLGTRIWPAMLFVIIFPGFLFLSSIVSQETMNSRLPVPLYIPMVIIITGFFAVLTMPGEGRLSSPVGGSVMVVFFMLWIALIANSTFKAEFNDMVFEGGGLNTRASRENDVASYLKDNRLDKKCKIYTNFVEAAYYLGGIGSSKSLSTNELIELDAKALNEGKPAIWPPESKACLAWFNDRIDDNYVPVDGLKKVSNVRSLATLKYGAVYKLSPLSAK